MVGKSVIRESVVTIVLMSNTNEIHLTAAIHDSCKRQKICMYILRC